MSQSLYLMRHCVPQPGERMDSERGLTDAGKKQAADMAAFMVRQVGRCDIVISSPFARAVETAEIMAQALGCHVATTTLLEPDRDPEDAWKEIERLAQASADVLVVGHHPEIGKLADWLVCDEESKDAHLAFQHGSVALIIGDKLQWLVTPQLVEKDEGAQEILEAAAALVELHEATGQPVEFVAKIRRVSELEDGGELWQVDTDLKESRRKRRTFAELRESGAKVHIDEKGEYTYDEVEQKRLILGDGGKSGNCDYCEDAAARGWIDMDDVFEGPDGDVDEAPLHLNCTCETEQKTRRQRVYA